MKLCILTIIAIVTVFIVNPVFPMDNLDATSAFSKAFQVGKKYQSNSNNDIYLQYSDDIDVRGALKDSQKEYGFKIFRTREKSEVGYILGDYWAPLAEIRIDAVWIDKDMRCKGYCTKAIRTLISLFISKHNYFSDAKNFIFWTKQENKAMMKVAQKVGFEKVEQKGFGIILPFLPDYIPFRKPYIVPDRTTSIKLAPVKSSTPLINGKDPQDRKVPL